MNATPGPNDFPPQWLIRVCRFLWGSLHGWWSVGVSIFLNIVATLLALQVSPLAGARQLWMFNYRWPILTATLLLLCFTLFVGYISKFETTPSHYARLRHYLRQMILDHERLQTSGIPEIFFPPSIKLQDVFIAPTFVNERTAAGIDYPLREEEIPTWRRIFARHRKRPPRELLRRPIPKIVGLTVLWHRLSREHPVAIVQGYPGMGKSTLMKRLTLHMARRCLRQHDPLLPVDSPALVPVLVELKTYADSFKKAQERNEELPLSSYLPQVFQKRTWQGKNPWSAISRCLEEGRCLLLFDGLDEAGDAEVRRQIARAINAFILEQRNTPPKQKTFNRFLITTRVAGYSPEAFPDALPYRIAELTQRQKHDLLSRWYRAVLQEEPAAKEAETRMQRLHAAIDERGLIFRLAENPFLLMLMAAMQKHGVYLPRGRAELYDTITLTVLKYREMAKDLPPIDEDEAIRRLGPLAYEMQKGDSIADTQMVRESLRKTIREERARNSMSRKRASDAAREQAEVEKEVQRFLTLIRERSNLFVQRTGEDFSFFHKSFQEYFAARFLLSAMQHRREEETAKLIELARQLDDVWREPFLFAIGYQSLGRGRDQTVAYDLLEKLLQACEQELDADRRLHDFLLAADAVVEAKAQTFDEEQERLIAQGLLQCYSEAQRQGNYADCEKVERAFKRWLLMLSDGETASALLTTLCGALQDCSRVDLQRATLTMLAMILFTEGYPQPVYESLIPHLLGLADLPALNGRYQPAPHSSEVDYAIADLAFVALSRMGHRGPAGLLIDSVRQYFEREPEQFRLLARYSLEIRAPLLLAIIEPPPPPRRRALDQWSNMRKRREQHPRRSINEDLPECFAIQQKLLDSSARVKYPFLLHLLEMLKASRGQPDETWQEVWRAYIWQQMTTPKPYIYQEMALLWLYLFPEDQYLKRIAELVLTHFTQDKTPFYRLARRFLAAISIEIINSPYRRNLRISRNFWNTRVLTSFIDSRSWRGNIFLKSISDISRLNSIITDRYNKNVVNILFLAKTAQKSLQLLPAAEETEAIELCTILLGCILQAKETNESLQAMVGDTQRFVDMIVQLFANSKPTQNELRDALLDILRYLPTRSGNEITFVCHVIENAADEEVQRALARALIFARSHEEALPALQAAASSTNEVIARAAQEAIRRRERERQARSV